MKIDKEFQDLIPPLTQDEHNDLELSLKQEGCRDALLVWKEEDILLDGHTRYKMCQKHGIKFNTTEISLPDRLSAMIWIRRNQASRRNLTDDQRAMNAAELAELESKKAMQERAKAGREAGGDATPEQIVERNNRLRADAAHKRSDPKKETTRKSVAKQSGVSTRKVRQAQTVKKASPELARKVASGELPLKTAVQTIRREKNEEIIAKKTAEKIAERATNPDKVDKGPYDLILADPPWKYDFAETESRAIENHYPTETVEEICKHIPNAAKDSILLLWATAPKLQEALQVMEAWGYAYKSNAIWDKQKTGMGYWFRGRHELLLVGTKGKVSPPDEKNRPASVFEEPRSKHSKKPDCVYQWIEKAFPHLSKLEMYCRTPRKGWAVWGNEV